MKCRYCKNLIPECFLDLGSSPPSNAYLSKNDLQKVEYYYPLRVYVCMNCWLVQIEDHHLGKDLFTDSYAYFSSVSTSWLNHAKNYVDMIVNKLKLNEFKYVIEIASNDGYLLQYFRDYHIPCLGIEPTMSTVQVARNKGIKTLRAFFSKRLATKLPKADLVIGNNVLAHVPDINDFVMGLSIILKESGVITLEFPHLLNLIEKNQFDTIYHEHFSYFSLFSVIQIFKSFGLKIFDVEELPTHGGSLRIYVCHENLSKKNNPNVSQILKREEAAGLRKSETYLRFKNKVLDIKNEFVSFLLKAKRENKMVVAYGAAAKGNTILNFSGIKKDLLPVVYDSNEYKQFKYLPGSHIAIRPPKELENQKVDYLIIFPWNLREEIVQSLSKMSISVKNYVTFIPNLKIM